MGGVKSTITVTLDQILRKEVITTENGDYVSRVTLGDTEIVTYLGKHRRDRLKFAARFFNSVRRHLGYRGLTNKELFIDTGRCEEWK